MRLTPKKLASRRTRNMDNNFKGLDAIMGTTNYSTAVVFDWDGTILDTDFIVDEAIEAVIGKHQPDELNRLQHLLYTSKRPACPLSSVRLPMEGRETILKELAFKMRTLVERAPVFDGAKELIYLLQKLAVPLAILTKRDRTSLSEQLERSSLASAFKLSVCRGEVQPKPNPEGLILISRILKVNRVVMIGNSMDDLLCARNANCEFVAVDLCSRVRESQICKSHYNVESNYNDIQEAVIKKLLT